jgi:hypothetical protein
MLLPYLNFEYYIYGLFVKSLEPCFCKLRESVLWVYLGFGLCEIFFVLP